MSQGNFTQYRISVPDHEGCSIVFLNADGGEITYCDSSIGQVARMVDGRWVTFWRMPYDAFEKIDEAPHKVITSSRISAVDAVSKFLNVLGVECMQDMVHVRTR